VRQLPKSCNCIFAFSYLGAVPCWLSILYFALMMLSRGQVRESVGTRLGGGLAEPLEMRGGEGRAGREGGKG